MWILLPTGFLSAVAHRDDPDLVLVRAREPEPIERVIRFLTVGPGCPATTEDPSSGGARFWPLDGPTLDLWADYPFRLVVPREAWGAYLALEARELEATNMKAEAEAVRGIDPYTRALHAVWRVLFDHLNHRRVEPTRHRWRVTKK